MMGMGRNQRAVFVFNGHVQPIVIFDGDIDQDQRVVHETDAVFEGVFHQRNQEHGFNTAAIRVFGRAETHGHVVAETEHLQIDIGPEIADLVFEGDQFPVGIIEHVVHQSRQLHHHRLEKTGFLTGQEHHAIQYIEHEMGAHLGTQKGQLGPQMYRLFSFPQPLEPGILPRYAQAGACHENEQTREEAAEGDRMGTGRRRRVDIGRQSREQDRQQQRGHGIDDIGEPFFTGEPGW